MDVGAVRQGNPRRVREGRQLVTAASFRDIAVLVVTWNGEAYLPACLDSILNQSLPWARYEVLVVDNASNDGTRELLQKRYPHVRVIASASNRGFAGGCALGLKATRAPVAVLLNNDAVAAPDFLERIVEPLSIPDVAATTAKVLLMPRFREARAAEPPTVLADGRALVVADGQDDPSDLLDVVNSTGNEVDVRGYGRDRGWLTLDTGPHPADVFGFCGAAAALDTAAVSAVGGFDEDYFLYYEDTDLSWRLRLAGYRIVHVPSAVVRHHHAASSREGSDVHRFFDERNRLLTLTKNAPASLALRAVLRYPLTTASIARHELPRLARTRSRLRAAASYLAFLPRMLRKRRAVRRICALKRSTVAARLLSDPATSTAPYRP
jgi:N-acetylglucosaminyl-diphospho-decaprenol L-rhamnosyltransferase